MNNNYVIKTVEPKNIITDGVEFNSFIKKARDNEDLSQQDKAEINQLFNEIQFKKKNGSEFENNLKISMKGSTISFGGQQNEYAFEIVNPVDKTSVYVSVAASDFGVFMGYPIGNEKKITPEIIKFVFQSVLVAATEPDIFDKMNLFAKINNEVIDKNTQNKKVKI